MNVGSLIKKARRKRGLSLGALGRLSGVGTTTLCRIENGLTDSSPDVFLRISDALSLPADDILLAAGLVPPDITKWLLGTPGALSVVREKMGAAA